MDKKTDDKPGEWFTEREENFILTMMGIQNCTGGKDAGIALTYEMLDPQYRYKVSISKARSIEEMEAEKEKLKGVTFIKQFMAENVNKSSQEIAKALADYVNEEEYRKERSGTLNTLTMALKWEEDEQWKLADNDFDILMTEKGASALLGLVEKEAKAEAVNAFIGQAIQKLMAAQFTGTNELMQELTEAPKKTVVDENTGESKEIINIEQGAHQLIYLKNLIGGLVGVSQGIAFDRHTGVLYDRLLARGRDEVLEMLFSKYVTPESYVNEIVRVVNELPEDNKQFLKPFLDNGFWDEAGNLNRQGVLSLLVQFDFLQRVT